MGSTAGRTPPGRVGLCLIALGLAGLAPSRSVAFPQPQLHVSPTTALVDERIQIAVTGLRPGQPFAIRATTRDQRERPWVAQATFEADSDGRAELGQVAPLAGGTYAGPDGMGLFWSAVPKGEGYQFANRPGIVYRTTLELVVEGENVGIGHGEGARPAAFGGRPLR